ncbi:hypothetical protein SUGI_0028520 [Cryptomeria japonica]|uniref:disease resistance protein Roq1 n=1 Tax=Cryptomeria japonica TaxID=3369 RepID=UPI002408C8E9|nr:disease resistance protein Roq1 [Cryptomeria japonica]GLJ05933.1 hypothetical protein SUGI_0028520 [Cryptomeria japonica]
MASTSSSGRREEECDVFINYGPDVETALALQLYNSLQQDGIQAYLDSQETQLGDSLSSIIFSAAVHIAILSPQYAESPECLAKLALIFQTKARIIPLFYSVQPSDFRYIKKRVEEAFSKHGEKGKYPNYDIQQWKDCLQNVAGIKGYELNGQNDDLIKLCKDVVSAVKKEKQKLKTSFQVAKFEVGLDDIVEDFDSHCQRNGQMIDKIIGIYGMGGSGKTTLVKSLFKRKHSEFSGSASLFDVREKHVKGELTSLQSELLNHLFPQNHYNFCSIEEGTARIKHVFQRSRELRFFIVIDDVDDKQQLDALLPIDALSTNSLVLVTTRDERVLIQAGVRVRYKMKQMNAAHSRQLFCWHAFHRPSCDSGFENLVDGFVEACGGLPLALRVLAAHVSGNDKGFWKLQLDDVKAKPMDIKEALKISYDALEEDQKQIFMDIACFFIRKEVSTAISIWKASRWRAEYALQTLKDKCLVEVTQVKHSPNTWPSTLEQPLLGMHDHLRDLGREMADDQMNSSRLWHPKDLIGMRELKGLQDILTVTEGKNFRCFNYIGKHEKTSEMKYFLESSKTSSDLRWLQLKKDSSVVCIPEWIPVKNLQTSILEGGLLPPRLWQRDDQAPLKLKELSLVENSNVFRRRRISPDERRRRFWESQERLKKNPNVNVLMRDVNELVSSFGMLKHLESLHLEFLKDYDSKCSLNFLRELTSLKTLELSFLKIEEEIALINRGETTDTWFHMRSLEAITLRGIFSTRKVSISGQFCPNLKSLKLFTMTDLIEVDLTGVTTLEQLELFQCRELVKVLGNDLLNLEVFLIQKCGNMKELPNFGSVNCLKKIDIRCCWNLQDISAIETFKGLKRIWIKSCPNLQNIKATEELEGLKRIWIQKCPKLLKIQGIQEWKELKRICIMQCPKLQSIEGIEFLSCLESIIITDCPKLQNIRGIEEMKGLKDMILTDTPIISCLESLQRLPSELTIVVEKSATLNLKADKIRDTLGLPSDALCAIKPGEKVEEKIHSFQKTLHPPSTFIYCTMLRGRPSNDRDICNGTCCEGVRRYTGGYIDCGKWIYLCVVNEEMLSKYEFWMPPLPALRLSKYDWTPEDWMLSKYDFWITEDWMLSEKDSDSQALLIGVQAGSERKTLDILQKLFAQLCNKKEDGKYADNSDDFSGYFYNDRERKAFLMGGKIKTPHSRLRQKTRIVEDRDLNGHEEDGCEYLGVIDFIVPAYDSFADHEDEKEQYDANNDDYNDDLVSFN